MARVKKRLPQIERIAIHEAGHAARMQPKDVEKEDRDPQGRPPYRLATDAH